MKIKTSSPIGIIAVEHVQKTSKLLIHLFNWKSIHGGREFDILATKNNEPTLMLHDFDAHEHKRFRGIHKKSKGVGQSFYVFTKSIDEVYKKVQKQKLEIVEPLFLNENSEAREFTFQIKEGYHFSVCETDQWLYYWV